jgi:hypothetical protein
MPVILESWSDISGEAYSAFVDMATDWFGFFSLVWRDGLKFDDRAIEMRRDLDRYETNRRRVSHWAGTRVFKAAGPIATIISFRICEESRGVLKRPGSLFAWIAPAFPEDIAFYKHDGELAFASCTHDRLAWAVDLDFGYTLPKQLGFTPREMSFVGDGGFQYVA